MAMKVIVPQLGESVVEGVLGKWHFKEGDRVERDQTLLEIETDKINLDIPCPMTGTLAKILVPDGSTVVVEQVIGLLLADGEVFDQSMLGGEAGGAVPQPASHEPKTAPQKEPKTGQSAAVATPIAVPTATPIAALSARLPMPQTGEEDARSRLSPAVRRLVEEYRLNADEIPGTGEGGRIRKIDVERFLSDPTYRRTAVAKSAAVETTPTLHELSAQPVASVTAPKFVASGEEFPTERIALTPIRKTIAQAMQRSKNTAAHTLDIGELDCTNLVKFRNSWKERINEEYGVNLTYMPFFVKAAVAALKKFPYMNASITDDVVILKHYYNIGFAADTEAGLVVPNIKHAGSKSIIEIAREMRELSEKARARKLTMEDISGGTFTLTNAGGYGALLSSPVINYPEVGILGIHTIEKRPVVRNNEIVIRDMMYLALQFDHRLIDGVYAIKFRSEIQRLLESPELLFMNV